MLVILERSEGSLYYAFGLRRTRNQTMVEERKTSKDEIQGSFTSFRMTVVGECKDDDC